MDFTQRKLEELLTKKAFEKLTTDKTIFDDEAPGLGLRRRPSGAASWVFVYKLGRETKQRKMTLGVVSAIPLPKAREIAKAYGLLVKDGEDPAANKAVKVVDAAMTFLVAAKRFLDFKEGKIADEYHSDIKRHLEKDAEPLHSLPVKAVKQSHIRDFLNDLKAERSISNVNHVRASLSTFFTWANQEGLRGEEPTNPVANTAKEKTKKDKGQGTERVLSWDEIRAIWKATEAQTQYNHIIRLMLLTGQRRDEIASLDRSEVHFDESLIIIPVERMQKGKAVHVVPMSAPIIEILKKYPAKIQGRTLYFGNGRGQQKKDNGKAKKIGFAAWSQSKLRLDARIKKITGEPVKPWVHHDLRHTMKTWMQSARIPKDIRNAVQSHTDGDMDELYGHYTFLKEKREVLDQWAARVLQEVSKKDGSETSPRHDGRPSEPQDASRQA